MNPHDYNHTCKKARKMMAGDIDTIELNDNLKFLIACSQTEPTENNIKFIQQFLPSIDKQELISLAIGHGILPLVYKTLKYLNTKHLTVNTEILSEFKAHYMRISQRNMLMSAELIRIMKLLKENNSEALAFKGPALAQIAYGDISLRQYSDLDIFIHKSDFRALAKKMLDKGYESLYPIETFTGDKVMFEINNDSPFYDKKRGLAIEIHWDFFRKLALPTKKFSPWNDTQTISINGHAVQTLSHETHLLYHSLHGSKHVWERLEWIVDIDRLIRSVPTLNWDKILKMAKDMGAQKMFLLGIALAQRYFQTPLPENILILCKNSKLKPFIAYVEAEFSSDDPATEDSLVKWSKVVGLRDNMYYKVLTVLEFLFRPGINERRTVILPDFLFWLYWPLRPFGMGFRLLFCRLLHLCKNKNQ